MVDVAKRHVGVGPVLTLILRGNALIIMELLYLGIVALSGDGRQIRFWSSFT